MYVGLHVKWRYYCQILMKLGFSRQIFEKISKFRENPSSGCWACSMRADGQTDMTTKLIIAFRNFANAPKNWTLQKKGPVWIHSDISHRKHVPSFLFEWTPRSAVRLQKLTVARLVTLYGTGYLLTCLHILALTFTWPSSPSLFPRNVLPFHIQGVPGGTDQTSGECSLC